MLVLNPRMVEGSPLHYYNPYQPAPAVTQFPFFNRFEQYATMSDLSEDVLRSHSPNSEQSDSDNSLSSVEIRTPKSEIKCCWRSCGITFSTLDQLSTHVTRVHASSGPGGLFYCGWDGCTRNNKGFNARYKMLVHVRTHTNEKPHKCDQCDKSFSRAENLKIHSRSHSGEKPYTCPVPGCNKAYSNSSDRFKHTRTHQVEKPYQCKVPGCPKRYTDPSSLRKHVKTYKHFVNDDCKTLLNKQTHETVIKNEPVSPYYCPHKCCVTNNKTELLRLSAFINLNEKHTPAVSWNNLFDPFDHDIIKETPMQVDNVPLDLSIRGTHV